MIGQPDDILKALNIAVANITAENRYSPGVGARVAVAALYEIGMRPGRLGNTSRIMTKTVERIMQDRCSSYGIDGTRVAREDTNGPTI